jgi:5-enolpyruvylshikimate-3-phosphate synthase
LSLAAFGIVAATAHAATLEILNPTKPTDGIGAEIIYDIIQKQDTSPMDLDLRDCNDLLPALSAYLAMGPGGRIRNAAHARFKESDRISKTVEMLECFGINVKAFEDGIETEGKQIPTRPTEIVNVYGDHRLFMTAACIASKTGGEITDNGVWSITDPSFPIQIGF